MVLLGAISGNGLGPLIHVQGIMTAVFYRDSIVRDALMPYADKVFGNDWYLAQDNDAKHTAMAVKEFLAKESVRVFQWPSYSPDLNPIENCWGYVKNQLRGKDLGNRDNLFKEVLQIWNQIPFDFLLKLIDSMPRRIEAVIRAQGGYTKY